MMNSLAVRAAVCNVLRACGKMVAVTVALCFCREADAQPQPCSEWPRQKAAEFMQMALPLYGFKEFAAPRVVTPTDPERPYLLSVQYGYNQIAGCSVYLRSYNGNLVGDTIRAKPGDTLYLRLANNLPAGRRADHPQQPAPAGHAAHFSFDTTNLHTHGLHVDPVGSKEYASDNVLLEIAPGFTQDYRITIDEDHPTGLFWYHAHLHGSTAMQVSSGMAGAIIIEGGSTKNGDITALPEFATLERKIFVLQQILYEADGRLENFKRLGSSNFRPTLVNGQLVPTIRMRPGEIQRWGFVHAGVNDNIQLALEGHSLYEFAADGITLGRLVPWPAAEAIQNDSGLFLAPGYRTEVLVKANFLEPGETERIVYLRDMPLATRNSIVSAQEILAFRLEANVLNATLVDAVGGKPEQILARVIISGSPIAMDLPSPERLASLRPASLPNFSDEQINADVSQEVRFDIAFNRQCGPDGFCDPATTEPCKNGAENCYKVLHLVNDHIFTPTNIRQLKLNKVEKWRLSGARARHPFHIHVNPFYMQRVEPGLDGTAMTNWLWKDTVSLSPDDGAVLDVLTQYTKFTGAFVLHCHILDHEDQGMMQTVEILR